MIVLIYVGCVRHSNIYVYNLLLSYIFHKHIFKLYPIFHLVSPYGKTKRIRWSKEEKEIALQVFSEYMEKLKLPSLHEIQTMKKKYTLLARRSSPQIKTWLHNQQKALRRQRKNLLL